MNGWGGRREGAGRGRVKRLDLAELQAYARERMSRARAAQFLGTSWAVVDREARRHGIIFPSTRYYGYAGGQRALRPRADGAPPQLPNHATAQHRHQLTGPPPQESH